MTIPIQKGDIVQPAGRVVTNYVVNEPVPVDASPDRIVRCHPEGYPLKTRFFRLGDLVRVAIQ